MQTKQVVFVVLIGSVIASPAAAGEPKARGAKGAQKAKVEFKLPDTVKVVPDIVYAKYGPREVLLDLYLPNSPPQKPLPCIMVIHGGGWRSGDKQRFAAFAAHLADHGFAAACIGYRLLPEVTFPAPILDCKAAVRWVRANAEKYGIDAGRIGAFGGSAGAHLSAMLGTSYKVAELEGEGGNPGVSSRVQAVVAMAAPTDMTRFGQRVQIAKETVALISPVTHVDADSAPTLLLHGEADKLVPAEQSELLAEKLKQAGVHVELVKLPDAGHGFWNQKPGFDDTMARTVKFFEATLNPTKRSSSR